MTQSLPIADLSLTSNIPCDIFDRIQIQTNPLGGNIINWGLKTEFAKRGPFHFYVDFGRGGTTEWDTLNKVPIIDNCTFIDPCQRHWDNQVDYYYRIRVLLPAEADGEGNCPVFASQPQQANGILTRSDWLLAREIIRKEILLRKKRTNKAASGFLLKRKKFGTVFTAGREFDTGERQATHDLTDFGTGFVGGYNAGIDYVVILDAPWKSELGLDGQVNTRRDIVRDGRSISYPYAETGDLWVRRDNGERYLVRSVTTTAEIGGIPLIQSLELRLAPVTDIIYRVPLDGTPVSSSSSLDSSSSSASDDNCSWRTGLNAETNW